jgi:cobalt-zinc-cadmium efflux system membrane fusion protein
MKLINRNHVVGTLLAKVPTLLVLVLLTGLAYVGYRTEWKLSRLNLLWGGGAASSEEDTEKRVATFNPETTVSPDPTQSSDVQKDCPIAGHLIELPSGETARQVGLQFATVQQRPLTATVTAPGEILYDPTLMTRLSARAPGPIQHIYKVVGDQVKKGDLLALVDSARVGEAKAELLVQLAEADLKEKSLERLRAAVISVAGREISEAEAALTVARARLANALQALLNLGLPLRMDDVARVPADKLVSRLRFLGLPSAVTHDLDPETASNNLLPVTAPFDGVVVERNVGMGEVVDASRVLFVIADVSRLWLRIDVRQEDADLIALGQPVAFHPDGHPGEVIHGQVSWISTTVDEKTRTQPIRAVADNSREHWRASTFGQATLTVRGTPRAAVVPDAAIQQDGACHAVFVRRSERLFQARPVRIGVRAGGLTEIVSGLNPGETVVTTGSHVLKSEILKRTLGDAD